MGLPTSRDVTFFPGVPIPSATLNHMQDALVAHEASTHLLLAGLLGKHLLAPGAPASLRPVGSCGELAEALASGGVQKLRYAGGLWLGGGTAPTQPLLSYLAAEDELVVSMEAPPALGLFRRDIVSVRLVANGSTVTLESSYTAGAAASSELAAMDPAVPDGFEKISSVLVVGTGGVVGTINDAKVRDFRFTAGYSHLLMPPLAMHASGDLKLSVANDWANGTRHYRQATAANQILEAYPWGRAINAAMRVRSLRLSTQLGAGARVRLVEKPWFAMTLPAIEVELLTHTTGSAVWTAAPSLPLWGNGLSNPAANVAGTSVGVQFVSGASGERVGAMTIDFWGGFSL